MNASADLQVPLTSPRCGRNGILRGALPAFSN